MEKFIRLIEFPKIEDPRGNLTFIEQACGLPFRPAEVSWLYDIPSDKKSDSIKTTPHDLVIMATSGQFTVTIHREDSVAEHFTLNRSNIALYMPALTSYSISDFVTGSTGLIISAR